MMVKTADGWMPWAAVHFTIPAAGGLLSASLTSDIWDVVTLDTSNVTNMDSMFYEFGSLTTIPLLDTSSVTKMSYMFYSCSSLTEIPPMDTSSVTNMNSMFLGCYSLTTVPLLDTSNVTNMSSMFSGCSSLTGIPALDMSSATSVSGFAGFTGNNASKLTSLTSFKAFGATRGWVMQGTQLNAAALNEVFTNLGTASGSQTLDVRDNPGSATCNPSIATAKGWTVLTT